MEEIIKIEIEKDGKVKTDFVGFDGFAACHDEGNRLHKILKELGVTLDAQSVRDKTPQQMRDELREVEESGETRIELER